MSGYEYVVHESPAGRSGTNYIAMVDLGPFGFSGQMEQIWLGSVQDGTGLVACIPFRVYGMAMHDTVRLDVEGKRVTAVVTPSGHRVLRIFFADVLKEPQRAELNRVLENEIGRLGLKREWSGSRHVAIDVPPDANPSSLEPLIHRYVAKGEVFWEWGDVESFRHS